MASTNLPVKLVRNGEKGGEGEGKVDFEEKVKAAENPFLFFPKKKDKTTKDITFIHPKKLNLLQLRERVGGTSI